MTTPSSRKRSSIHEKGEAKQPVKRQNSMRTLTAMKLEQLQLRQAPIADTRHMSHHEHQVPSVSPRLHQMNDDTDIDSFFPEAEACESGKTKTSSVHQDTQGRIHSSEMNSLVGGADGFFLGPIGSNDEEIVDCSGDDSCFDQDRKDSDEADGLFEMVKQTARCVGKTFKTVRYEVTDGCTDLINTVTSVLPHPRQQLGVVDTDDGFSVHLPSPLGNPVSFGIHLRRHERGCKVTCVHQDSPAHKAGLKESDILTHLDNVSLKGEEDGHIMSLFMKVHKTFCLTFLREEQIGDQTKLIEIKITVTITIDTVKRVIEVVVKVRRSSLHFMMQTGPQYITEDPYDKGQSYLNMVGRKVFMGFDSGSIAKFYFDIYAPNMSRQGQLGVIRNVSSSLVYNPIRSEAEEMDRNEVKLDCLLNKVCHSDNTFTFESASKKGLFLASGTEQEGVLLSRRPTYFTIFNAS